jgi:hypothetical protein
MKYIFSLYFSKETNTKKGGIIISTKQEIIKILMQNDEIMEWFSNWIDAKKMICYSCNKSKVRKSFYHTTKSKVYPDTLPICKVCANKLFFKYQREYDSPYTAMQRICLLLDIPWNLWIFKSCLQPSETNYVTQKNVVGKYLQKLNLRQNRRKKGYKV